ncbi:single-stranded DNA-binding protein [Kocuria marina]|uniref:single-stranded DNA-binding protein n=1 Tax=Kocuria TaxID=57493 RepID=UPI0018769432|nr:hypothetical protein GCM10007061_08850 [Kocuria marina]
MAGDTVITVIGNLTADPELRFTPSGAAVANFTVASTPRAFDRQSNEWKDQETLFMRCSVWREAAENVAESLTKGTRVIVQGRLKARSYETKEGERRTSTELEVDEIGPSMRYATAKINRNSRGGGNSYGGNQGFGGGQGGFNDNQGGGFGGNQGGGNPGGGNPGGGNQGGGFNGNQGGRGGQQPRQQGNDPWGQSSGGNYDWGTGAEDEPPF